MLHEHTNNIICLLVRATPKMIMLLEILDSTKTSLIFKFSKQLNQEETTDNILIVDMINLLLCLLNSEISWNSITNDFKEKNIMSPSSIRRFISNLDESPELKNFLSFFCMYNSKIFSARLLSLENFLNDIKKLTEKENLSIETILEYINVKYSPKEIKSDDDRYQLTLFHPLLLANNIDTLKFYNKLPKFKNTHNTRETAYDWIKNQTNNEIHLSIFKKLLFDTSYNTSNLQFLNLLSFDELLEYLKLKAEYENSCTKYKFTFMEDCLVFAYLKTLQNHTNISKCNACGKHFISTNGAKVCSDNCRNTIRIKNQESRNKTVVYEESNNAINHLHNKIINYSRKADNNYNKQSHRTIILSGFKLTYDYYCYIRKVVNYAIQNNIDNIENDDTFINHYKNWLIKISNISCDLDNTPYKENVRYIKFSKTNFEEKECSDLFDNEIFMLYSKYKLNKKNEIIKKKSSQKTDDLCTLKEKLSKLLASENQSQLETDIIKYTIHFILRL